MKIGFQLIINLSSLITVLVSAGCDNQCSGHGTCGEQSLCTCYDNWGLGLPHYSGDCSQRICPYDISWVDTPDKKGRRHKYAECSSQGICNRDSGECECFEGFEGHACQRSNCPNDCSGHGRCMYIEDMPFYAVPQEYSQGYFLQQEPQTFKYYYWDKKKTRGCYCDSGYGDLDCSKRMCPYGTDVMDQRNNLDVAAKYQVQQIFFEVYNNGSLSTITDETFAITFKSRLNETFTTIPIVFKYTDLNSFSNEIQLALESLPNYVIDKVNVASSMVANTVMTNISFTGDSVQGPQHLLTVKAYYCGDGCTPKVTGLSLEPKTQNVTEIQLSDYQSYECGRRGKCDYSSGVCQCFAGYTGINCNTITSLI